MALFDFFKSTPQTNSSGTLQTNDNSASTATIPEEIFIERMSSNETPPTKELQKEASPINNLDSLFTFLDRNLESKGYDDALMNPDSYHLEQNLDAYRKELLRAIKRVKTFYEDFIKEINYHIESRSRSGMIDTVEELRMKKEIADGHIQKVLQLELEAINNEGDSQGIIISYTRGFRNGLAAISHHAIINKQF